MHTFTFGIVNLQECHIIHVFSADPSELLEPRTSNMVMFARKLAVPFSEILRFHLKDNIKLHKLLFKWIARW